MTAHGNHDNWGWRADQFPPGSPGAVLHGCGCPRLDNAHGKGYRGPGSGVFVQVDCKYHGPIEAMLGSNHDD